MSKPIHSVSAADPSALSEVITLGRTLKKRAADVLAHFDRPGTRSGPTEAINGRIEHLRGSALGFRNLPNYIAQSLLETGGFRPQLHPEEPLSPWPPLGYHNLAIDSTSTATIVYRYSMKGTIMESAADRNRLSRRSLALGGGAVIVAGAAGVPSPGAFAAGPTRAANPVLETVQGPVQGDDVRRALAHEHFFVDFLGPTSGKYMNVDWTDATGAAVNAARELRKQRVNLVIDWTCLGVGRNVSYLRDVSRQSGVHIVAATGIYKSLVPPALERASIDDMAAHFATELTRGIDGTTIRAGFIKCATTESGPTAGDTRVHRAAARAARRTGATIALHCPHADVANSVADTFEREGFDLRRFLWGHSQVSSSAAHVAMAQRGASVQFDAIGAESDPFFGGPTDDASMLNRIQAMVEAGFGHRVTVSNDASVVVHPPIYQYDRDPLYLYRTFYTKLVNRLGREQARQVTRDNVVRIFRRGARID